MVSEGFYPASARFLQGSRKASARLLQGFFFTFSEGVRKAFEMLLVGMHKLLQGL